MTFDPKKVLVTVAKDVDLAATDVLRLLASAEKAAPAAKAALAVLLAGFQKAVTDVQTAAANPANVVNVAFDSATFADVKAVWSDVVAFAATLGIKL